MLSNRPDYGRTFNTAMWLVGLIASIQLFAVVWAVFSKANASSAGVGTDAGLAYDLNPIGINQPGSEGVIPSITLPPIPEAITRAIEQQNREAAAAGNLSGEPQNLAAIGLPSNIGGGSDRLVAGGVEVAAAGANEFAGVLPEPSFYGPEDAAPSLSEALAEAAMTVPRIEEPLLDRLVSAGEELRAEGNMPSALQALRQAEEALPEHPRVMGQIAATLSQMGSDANAEVYWQRLLDLGKVRSGGYYELARRQLMGEEEPKNLDVGKVMSIGEIKVDESSPGTEGQKVSLRIVIDSDPSLEPVGDQLSLLVYFYDLVDGERVDASTADTSYLYPTEPYNWQTNGTEEIVVNYDQPVFTEEQKRELGERRYFGYAIELYYRDRLQDRVVRPEEIAELRRDESGMDSDSAPRTFGPENALFPDSPNF